MQEITTQNDFDYSLVDFETQEFLQERSNIIYGIQSKSAYEIGKQLVKAQEVLAKNRYGCFEEWYSSLGFRKTKAYEYINHYNFIRSQSEQLNIETFEELPKKLQSEMSKPSANPELNQKVFDGDITTHKQYKELERQLKLAEADKERLKQQNERLAEQALSAKVVEKEVVIEKVPDDYESTKQLNRTLLDKNKELSTTLEEAEWELDSKKLELSTIKLESQRAIEVTNQIRHLEGKKEKLENLVTSISELSSIISDVQNFFDTKMAPLRFKPIINNVNAHYSVTEVTKMVNTVQTWCDEMYKIIPSGNRKTVEEVIINE
ncbi:TPA: hypothetical protein ACGQQ7_000602 [Streptococcus agalactiae]|jgi:hypothetical protein|uniref:DUF3102 domain-containing protein n=1 Tax=Streptococcus agalactiae CCUG 29376 TaxID=1105255 RepID=A0AAV3JM03_STRAG|nr:MULTISPECIES: hypothetical protein [Streptococcus]AYJ74944.1 hypothetical protein [Streptococcus phage LF2]MEE3707137.1 hypothetical protein [Streptococcus sp. R3]AYY67559.1 hypothetical protein EGX72_00380 [Streptococcus sp. FDAARGOS_521]EPT92885.1 hypothetical protein SAG0105_00415 [Streptococcus agalactiae BSU96]EPT98365.1 hypothetical protein SAG0106_05885 [Streptococcus agalactiae BSU165]